MAIHDFTSQRLFVEAPLAAEQDVACTDEQANYLSNVLRLGPGASLLVFNGRDGEWRAEITLAAKRRVSLNVIAQVRTQSDGPDIDYLFAPLKRSRLDYMVQKAVEMGVKRLVPVMTKRTVAERVNLDRMRANVIEAAEQCGILRIPEIAAVQKLNRVIADWDGARHLVFCDEEAPAGNPIAALRSRLGERKPLKIGVLLGPEGGFDPEERDMLLSRPFTIPISLGPRILRADTAAVAALAVINATTGDWD
jgi:16S rRNA (uracil1498-N3)-methyltransferase